MKKRIGSAVLITAIMGSMFASAQHMRPLNDSQQAYYGEGYTIVIETPIAENGLNQTILKNIKAKNIREGIHQILNGTGWRFADERALNPRISNLLDAPWPAQWSLIGPDSLNDILNAIGGEGWQLVVDPVNRLVGFDIKPKFRGR